MSLFESIKNAIFGSHPATATPTAGAPKPTAAAPQQSAAVPSQAPAAPGSRPAPPDINAILTQRAAGKHEKLNWQSSIVDLMKLVDLDPSLDNRKTLAKELGYSGDTNDSASMNIWLHKQVMQKLQDSGGKVPQGMH